MSYVKPYSTLSGYIFFLSCVIFYQRVTHVCWSKKIQVYDKIKCTHTLQKDSKPRSYIPKVTNVNWSNTSTVLDILSITYINFHLPGPQQSEWRLLYSNSLHGDSFAQLVRFICDKGPSVMVIMDKDGHCFGGYVSESWDIKPQFYGIFFFLLTLSQIIPGFYMSVVQVF